MTERRADERGGSGIRLLEAVPNFSEGRNAQIVREIVGAMRDCGADVLDWSSDADHHRSVVTVVGEPAVLEEAAVAGARVAVSRIDLREHRGVHPRIGALDVLPFVPLLGLSMADARRSASRVAHRIVSDLGVPVFFYAQSSQPPGRTLAELRKGGFEALADGWPADRVPDLLPDGWSHPGAHPSAGATCVGARELLLAWNVIVRGITLETAREIAAAMRHTSGGPAGVRALALALPGRAAIQISMNLERVETASPMTVFRLLEQRIADAGGEIEETEVIGLVPDRLVQEAASERLRLARGTADRLLSRRVLEHFGGVPPGPLMDGQPDQRLE
jgi:glutamate formiminotransferase